MMNSAAVMSSARRGQFDVPLAIIAVHIRNRAFVRVRQWVIRPFGDRDIRAARDLEQAQRIDRRQAGVDVAEDRRQADQLQLGRGQREEDRHAVVHAGVGIDDDFTRHKFLFS
jgi:hypothetical protein